MRAFEFITTNISQSNTDTGLNLAESSILGEIKMTPNNLRTEAQSIDALVGIEFEFGVPGIPQDDEEPERDFTYNPKPTSIANIRDFFDDRDYNNGRALRTLVQTLEEEYAQWLEQEIEQSYENNEEVIVSKWIDYWYDDHQLRLIEEVLENDNVPSQLKSDVIEYARRAETADIKQLELFTSKETVAAYKTAIDGALELKEQYKQKLLELSDRFDESENPAYAEYRDDETKKYLDDEEKQREWFEFKPYYNMHDVWQDNEIEWPFWTTPVERDEAISTVANYFQNMIGRRVNWSSDYHGAPRRPNTYSVEPDSSISSEYGGGLEFISPPLPVEEMLDDTKNILEYARDKRWETNDSTGLHINVSTRNFSPDKLDFVKLVLLLGDQYILRTFERESNSFCSSAFKTIKNKAKQNPVTIVDIFHRLQNKLDNLASRVFMSTASSKYSSVNVRDRWVEFRGPGNDYLNRPFETIRDTVYRLVVVLHAACDPEAYREEYLKKLYKYLAPVGENTIVELFSKYATNILTPEQLRNELTSRNIDRQYRIGGTGPDYLWQVRSLDATLSDRPAMVIAKTSQEAKEKYIQNNRYQGLSLNRVHAVALKQLPDSDTVQDSSATTKRWRVYTRPPHPYASVENIYADNPEQAIRIARIMNPAEFNAISDNDLNVTVLGRV